MRIPPRFDDEFLEWFREATERAWSDYAAREFEDHALAGVGGLDWQPGTRWRSGLTEDEIRAIEQKWGLRFPPDHRLFLRRLHATDRPMKGALFVDGDELTPAERPGVYDWQSDEEAIRGALESVIDGLAFDVEHNALWIEAWGPRPSTPARRRAVLQAQVKAAPKLVPIFQHRALVAEPCRAGNPVLSIHQSDIIVYGADLREYLVFEFGALLGVREELQTAKASEWLALPFWGEFL